MRKRGSGAEAGKGREQEKCNFSEAFILFAFLLLREAASRCVCSEGSN